MLSNIEDIFQKKRFNFGQTSSFLLATFSDPQQWATPHQTTSMLDLTQALMGEWDQTIQQAHMDMMFRCPHTFDGIL